MIHGGLGFVDFWMGMIMESCRLQVFVSMLWGGQAKDNVAPSSEQGREEYQACPHDAPSSPVFEGFDVLPQVSDVFSCGEGLRFTLQES